MHQILFNIFIYFQLSTIWCIKLVICQESLQVQSFIRQFSEQRPHDFKKTREILTSPGGDYIHKYVPTCDAVLYGTYLPSYEALHFKTQ
jgi:hypothetical protein